MADPSALKKRQKAKYKTAAWQRKEGQNPNGGLNEKGRKSAGVKAPQPEGGKRKDSYRQDSYCARSGGQMKQFPKAAKDPNSRLRKARRKWNCGSKGM